MKTHIITLPRRLHLENTVQFSSELQNLPEAEEYLIDFQHVGRIEPFALLFLSCEIQRCRSKHADKFFGVINHQTKSYAAHMGFFKAFGCDFGKHPGEATGSSRYLPITIFDVAPINRDAAMNALAVGAFIENKAAEMAELLTRENSGDLYDALTYSIREIIRNVIEHSEADQFGFCAQYWPSYNEVELALLDRGIGVNKALSNNPHLKIDNDHEALNLALMPGVSGKAFKGVHQDKYDVWANSGFGLYMTSRLCREGGSFFIASGDTGLYLSENKKHYLNTPFKGTALRLLLRTDRISSLSSMLQRYRSEAQKIKSALGQKENLSASVASTMLTRDFK